jgi:hypothetical protein
MGTVMTSGPVRRAALIALVTLCASGGLAIDSSRADIRDSNRYTHSFYSEPGLHPPIVYTSGRDPDPNASGDVFADAENSVQAGPLILGPDGQLIYFQPLNPVAALNVQVQSYQGQTVLTYWEGYVNQGVGVGQDVILNHQYQQIATVRAGNGDKADLHVFTITPRGDAFISAYAPVRHVNLSSLGGPKDGTVLDSIIQEIDIQTGQVLWEWHAYHHVHLSESYAGKPTRLPYDFFHINSVQLLRGGNLLVSARHTWALYEISMRTRRIQEVIGGKHSYFHMAPGANFEWQHDAQMLSDGTITLFDDADGGPGERSENQSRALRLRIDRKTHRVTLVRAYTNNPPVLAASQGSVQALPDGNMFVGWGSQPFFSEFSKHNGRQLFSLHLAGPVESYRGYRFQWWGQPTTPPSIAAAPAPGGTRVYASWNGATDVASWRLLAGPNQDPTALIPVGQFPKTTFETTMWVPNSQPYVAVQALDSAGQVLDTSAVIAR